MRFDQPTIPLAPRTTLNCLDLAVAFCRVHGRAVFALCGAVAVPSCALMFCLSYWWEWTLASAAVLFFFVTSPLGVLLTVGAATSAFGEPMTFGSVMRRLRNGENSLLTRGILYRIGMALGLCLFAIPGVYILFRTCFFVESTVLKNLDRHLHDRRTDELLKGEFGDLLVRGGVIFGFCSLLALTLLLTADFAATHLLGLPILWGRLPIDLTYAGDIPAGIGQACEFLWEDPYVVTAALAAALAAYPVGRLAWFFCYIDVRVRRDCWDMELQILREAELLERGEARSAELGAGSGVE